MKTLVESNPNSAVGHEGHADEHHDKPHYDDVNVPSVVTLGVISALVTYIIIVFVQGLYYQWEASQIELKEYGTPVVAAKVITQQKSSMTGYLKAKDKDSLYKESIPIDRAMLLLIGELEGKSKQGEQKERDEHEEQGDQKGHGDEEKQTGQEKTGAVKENPASQQSASATIKEEPSTQPEGDGGRSSDEIDEKKPAGKEDASPADKGAEDATEKSDKSN